MKNFILFLLTLLSMPNLAQDKSVSTNLAYPDLIPVLIGDSLYGYCDKALNVKIKALFEKAELFEADYNFQLFHVNNPEIIKFGTKDFAWVQFSGERYRIDKSGARVYKYNAADFKTGETTIYLYKNSTVHMSNSIDQNTLLQEIKDSHTGKIIFPEERSIQEFREKNKDLIEEGVKLVFRPNRKKIPYTDFTNEQTLLKGIKNGETNQILIKAKYANIEELYNNPSGDQEYPLFIGYRGDLDKEIYVGLNGTEYYIQD
ncbi:MAG: hypothetical protein LBV59_05955 [Sphingobacterium sp.]|uniref:hypothetical protein n=1 Tax=Sphingobacterium sp. TaxID=341027 RepID=UPI00283E358C|nr:hypothetical protein [Sphingobacterium sp.]MDR3007458.1 hypothetical protein [Sphingobacterium sp.]